MSELVSTVVTVTSCAFILYALVVIYWCWKAPYCRDEPWWVRLFARMVGRD